MQWLASVFVLLFAAFASARSAFGNKLLVVLDDVAEKAAYSTFLEDMKGTTDIFSNASGCDA